MVYLETDNNNHYALIVQPISDEFDFVEGIIRDQIHYTTFIFINLTRFDRLSNQLAYKLIWLNGITHFEYIVFEFFFSSNVYLIFSIS